MTDDLNPDNGAQQLCVGRSAEIATLRSRLDLALQGQSAFCRVRGEAGSGKSTLLRAFVTAVDQAGLPAVIAWGHCDQQTGSIRPLAPWAQILQSFSGLSDIAIPEEQLRDNSNVVNTLRTAFAELAPDIIELLIPGFGLAVRSAKLIKRSSLRERLRPGNARPEEVAVAADRSLLQDQYVAIIERVLDQAPLIIVMDDLDCSDEASLQLLSRIAERTRGRKILFLVATRTHAGASNIEPIISRIAGNLCAVDLDLDAAREQRGPQLVAEYVAATIPGVGDGFVEELTRHTGGHPLFVTELVEYFRQQRTIVRRDGCWHEDPDLGWRQVPGKIENVLSAQLAGLDPQLLDVLQVGSVAGDQFSIEVAAAVLEKSPLSVARVLARDAPKNLVRTVGTERLGNERVTVFRFCHSLGRQHIYAGIDPLERVYLHGAVATHMEMLAGTATGSIAAQLAYQYERAGNEEKAREHYEIAAGHALSTCSLEEATTHLERALALCTGPLDELRIKHQLAKLNVMAGNLQAGLQLISQAQVIAEGESPQVLITVLADKAYTLSRLNDFESAETIATSAEQLARESGEATGLLSALETLASIHSKRGRHEEALACQIEALALVEHLEDESAQAESLRKYGWYLKELGRYAEAGTALRRSLEIHNRGVPNYSHLAITYNGLADMYINQEDYPAARENMEKAVEYWQRFDRSSDVAVGLSNLANLANREGLFEEALGYARRAYEEDLKVFGADHPDLAFSLTCIGESLLGLQQFEAAITALNTAYDLRRDHGAPQGNIAWTQWLLGRAMVESGNDVDVGMQYVADSRDDFLSLGNVTRSELSDVDSWISSHPELTLPESRQGGGT